MARCDEGYLCEVCGQDVAEITESDLYLRYVVGQIEPEVLHTFKERHLRCNPALAQFIVDERFDPPVVVEGDFDKRRLDAEFVRAREELVTRGYRRLHELAAGAESAIIRYPLPEVVETMTHDNEVANPRPMRVLFLCTGNSCRSQMAEGWARHLHVPAIEVYSAGIIAKGLDPLAVEAMREVGIDISGQRSKTLADLGDVAFDVVITVCGNAHETCPIFPGKTRVVHVGFDDPPRLAEGAGSREEAMRHYRRVRDEIREFVVSMIGVISRK